MNYRLRDIRIARGYTQRQIALYLCISRSAYTLYESGKRQPPIPVLCRLADFYHVSVDYLVGR